MKKSLILIPFAALVLAGCSYSPTKPTSQTEAPTSEPVPTSEPTSQSVDPTSQSVDPTSQSVDPTSDTSVGPTTGTDTTTGTTTGTTTDVPPGTHDGLTPETAFTGLEAAAKCQEIGSTYSTEKYYVVDTVFSKDSGFSTDYGSHSFHLGSDAGLYCYRLKNGANHDKFTSDSDIEVGDTVMVYGQLVLYNSETPEMSYSYNSGIEGYVYSIQKSGQPKKVTSVNVTPASANLEVGGTQQLNVEVLPADAENKNVTYETSASSVATVSNAGLITAVAEGYATITVKSTDGSNKSGICNVTVGNPTPPTTHDGLTPETAFTGLEAAAKCQEIGSTYSTEKYYVVDTVFSKDSGFSTDYGSHSFHLGSDAGLYCYRLKNGANHDKFTSDSDIEVGDTVMVYGQLVLYNGQTPEMSYSYNSGIEGYVYSITKGGSEVKVTSVSVNPTSANLKVGGTQQLTPTVLPADATNRNVTYESNAESVASVSDSGLITANGIGNAVITVKSVSDPSITAFCNVSVSAISVTGVRLDEEEASLTVGQQLTLNAIVSPSNATNQEVEWFTNNSSVATVNGGVVTAINAGEATIKVTTVDGGFEATCDITVTGSKVDVTGVTLNSNQETLLVGSTFQLEATIMPEDATVTAVSWSATGDVSVDQNGLVTANAVGNGIVTVTTQDGEKTAMCVFKVNPVAVTGVTLNQTTASLTVGQQLTLNAIVSPSNATNKNVSWSSNNEHATVIGGVVTAVSEGTSVITVTTEDGSFEETCTVTISAAPAEVDLLWEFGTEATAADYPSSAMELADIAACYESGRPEGISLTDSDNGFGKTDYAIKAGSNKNPGSLTFTTTDAIKKIELSIVAERGTPVVTVGGSEVAATSNYVYDITANNVTEFTISKNPSSSKALFINSMTVTVGASGPVTPVAVTGVSLDKTSAEVAIGETVTLKATIAPASATNKAVTWSSSVTSVATVDNNGVVRAVGEGSSTITVTTVDGGYEETCLITVTSTPTPPPVGDETTYTFESQNDLKGWTCDTNPNGYEDDRGLQWSNGGSPGTIKISAPHAVTKISVDVSANATGGSLSCGSSSYTVSNSKHQTAELTVSIAQGGMVSISVSGSSKSLYIKSITLMA